MPATARHVLCAWRRLFGGAVRAPSPVDGPGRNRVTLQGVTVALADVDGNGSLLDLYVANYAARTFGIAGKSN
ncbi:MAG: hypothetical protein U1G07_01040 [Verrucomicrobiota bacterium]